MKHFRKANIEKIHEIKGSGGGGWGGVQPIRVRLPSFKLAAGMKLL